MTKALLVYLDQWVFGELLEGRNTGRLEELKRWVGDGEVVCPASMVHVLETGKRKDHAHRLRLIDLIEELSVGTSVPMMGEPDAMELRAFLDGRSRDWLRRHLIRSKGLTSQMLGLIRMPGLNLGPHIDSVFERAAATANSRGEDDWVAVRDRIAKGAGLDPTDLPSAQPEFLATFPTAATRLALTEAARKDRAPLKRNDICDFYSLSVCFPYFDLVTCDPKTERRLRTAQRMRAAPKSSARVESNLTALMGALRRLL